MPARKLYADEIAARLDALLLASLRQRSLAATAAALEALPRERQERVLHWVGVAALSSADLGAALADAAAAHGVAVAGPAFDDWVRAGLEAHDRAGLGAARAAWAEAAAGPPAGAALAELGARLARFASALAGRPVSLAAGASAAGGDGQGGAARPDRVPGDGLTLGLPPRLPSADAYFAAIALWWAAGDAAPPPAAQANPRAAAWFAVLEALRHEARLRRELPGLARRLAAARGPLPGRLAAAAADLGRAAATAADSLRWLARLEGEEPPSWPHLGLGQAVLAGGSPRLAPRVAANLLRGAGAAGSGETAGPPLAGGAAAAQGGAAAQAPPAATAADAAAPDQPAGPGAWQPGAGPGRPAEPGAAGGSAPDARLDEWDYRRAAYRRQWCHVFETEVAAGDPAWAGAVRQRRVHLIRRLRRRFEALRGDDSVLRRQLDGEDIDLDARIEAHADRRAGAEVSPRLYRRRQRDARSLAVMLMVDMSGSTKGWVNEAVREALVLLCEAIEGLGDRYAIYGFSGWTRMRCDIYRVKRFDERYDDRVRCRIAGIDARDYTRMGAAVRHLTRKLAARPERHKLLITLSDGRPDDHGDEYRGHYGIEDTRRALQEARVAGVRAFCVTIDRHGADYLPRLYGPAHYAVINDVALLPGKVAEIYRRLAA